MDTVLITGADEGVGLVGADLALASLLSPEPELVPGAQSCHPSPSLRHGGRGLHDEVARVLSGSHSQCPRARLDRSSLLERRLRLGVDDLVRLLSLLLLDLGSRVLGLRFRV